MQQHFSFRYCKSMLCSSVPRNCLCFLCFLSWLFFSTEIQNYLEVQHLTLRKRARKVFSPSFILSPSQQNFQQGHQQYWLIDTVQDWFGGGSPPDDCYLSILSLSQNTLKLFLSAVALIFTPLWATTLLPTLLR